MLQIKITCLILFVVMQLTSCAVGPDYKRPKVQVPPTYKELRHNHVVWKTLNPSAALDRGQWWHLYHDAELNRLETHLTKYNYNIASAYANYRQACALVDAARASFFPTLSFAAALTRQKSSSGSISASTGIASTSTTTATSQIFSTHSLIMSAAWAPDIWGAVRRNVEANLANAQANKALYANTRLSMQGSLAQFYFELRTLDAIQQLLNETVANDKKALRLTKNQYRAGVASRADVITAQTQLDTVTAQAINNQVNRATYEHAIAVLIGIPPVEFSLKAKANALKAPPKLPVSLPSTLLERRPDVAAAEQMVVQANAQIGVAVAAYFPVVNLVGNVNASGKGGLAQLFNIPTLAWSYGVQVTDVVFDGGLRAANIKAAQAGYDSKVATYRQTVLTAFQNVEDNLSSLRILKKQSIVEKRAARHAKEALQLTINQYKAGTVPYSSVITAQNNWYTTQNNVITVEGLRLSASVGLIMALGGGWEGLPPLTDALSCQGVKECGRE